MAALKSKGADSLFLYKHNTKLYDLHDGVQINVLEYLIRHDSMDMVVRTGSQKQYTVRIVAQRVNEEAANLRRMRAKKRSSHKNPSREVLALMSWTIYITTIIDQDISFETLLKLYGLRWRMENIFKTWKSNFSLAKIHNVSVHQLRVLIFARLGMITLFHHKMFNPLFITIYNKTGKFLSLMKFMRYIQKNIDAISKLISPEKISEKTMAALLRFCTYDRRKRKNFETEFWQLMTGPIKSFP